MTPDELLGAAERLIERPSETTRHVWARGAALLIRQALEMAMQRRLAERVSDLRALRWHTQLLALRDFTDSATATRAGQLWAALSSATHHHGYELPPSAQALRGWRAAVGEVVEQLEDGGRR